MTEMMDFAHHQYPISHSALLLRGVFGEHGGFRIGYGFRAGAGTRFAMPMEQEVVTGRITAIGKIRASGNSTQIPIRFP